MFDSPQRHGTTCSWKLEIQPIRLHDGELLDATECIFVALVKKRLTSKLVYGVKERMQTAFKSSQAPCNSEQLIKPEELTHHVKLGQNVSTSKHGIMSNQLKVK